MWGLKRNAILSPLAFHLTNQVWVRSWQTRLRRLFKLASMGDGHAHRFRGTFAVELPLAGVPRERVSVLLGHQSVRITEKHYAPWVRSRQEQLEADLARAWSRDPTRTFSRRGTREVHGRRRPRNSSSFNEKQWCPGWESNPHEEKSPEDFKSSASAIPPPGLGRKERRANSTSPAASC